MKLTAKLKKIILLIFGIILGYLYAMWAFGRSVGAQGIVPNIRIFFNQHEFLPHHWLTFPIYALIIYFIFRKQTKYIRIVYFVMAFLIGAAIQGFSYSDWFVIFKW